MQSSKITLFSHTRHRFRFDWYIFHQIANASGYIITLYGTQIYTISILLICPHRVSPRKTVYMLSARMHSYNETGKIFFRLLTSETVSTSTIRHQNRIQTQAFFVCCCCRLLNGIIFSSLGLQFRFLADIIITCCSFHRP